MRSKGRIVRRPSSCSSAVFNNRGFTCAGRPENPLALRFRAQCGWKIEGKRAAFFNRKSRHRIFVFILPESFRLHKNLVVAPNDQISAMLGYASFLRLIHQIVKSVERCTQFSVRHNTFEARHRHQKDDGQDGHRDDKLDQSKGAACDRTRAWAGGTNLHRRSYACCSKSQHAPEGSGKANRGIALQLYPTSLMFAQA